MTPQPIKAIVFGKLISSFDYLILAMTGAILKSVAAVLKRPVLQNKGWTLFLESTPYLEVLLQD
ncbi:MAG: hypothetical protein ACR2PG_11735 [Hyphomicrobiaceae bacterium]